MMKPKNMKIVFIAIAVCLINASVVLAKTAEPEELTLKQFVREAVEQDWQFKIALQQYLSTKYDALAAQAIDAWTLSARIGRVHQESVSGSALEPQTIDAWDYEASLNKVFSLTGTRLTLSHSNTLGEFEFQSDGLSAIPGLDFGFADSTSTPVFSVTLAQPLLKNAFGLMDRYPLRNAELQVQAARLDVEEAWEQRIQELYQMYYDWSASYETVAALQEIVSDLERLLHDIGEKVKTGIAEETDYLQAENTVFQYQSSLQQAEGVLLNNSRKIDYVRTGKQGEAIFNMKPQRLAQEELQVPDTVQPEQWRLIRKLELYRQQGKLALTVAENSRLPELNLVASLKEKGQTDDQSGGFDALDHQDYTLMVTAAYPLGAPKAASDAGKAQKTLDKLGFTIEDTRRELRLAADQVGEMIRRYEAVTRLRTRQVETMKKKMALDERNYRIGRLDIYFLIETENALTQAKLNRVKDEIELQQLKTQYAAVNDELLDRHPDVKGRLDRK